MGQSHEIFDSLCFLIESLTWAPIANPEDFSNLPPNSLIYSKFMRISPYRGITLVVDYLGKFESYSRRLKIVIIRELKGCNFRRKEKIQRSKISRDRCIKRGVNPH
jgi:hypothetical protein